MSTIEDDCDRVALAAGFHVDKFSVKARAQLRNLPDRYYRHLTRRIRLFWEAKSPTDKLTRAQESFLRAELDAGGLACCGGPDDLLAVIGAICRPHLGDAEWFCRLLIDRMVLRGYRDEPGSGPMGAGKGWRRGRKG